MQENVRIPDREEIMIGSRVIRHTIIFLLAAALASGQALADRHCAPVAEAYWRARGILQSEGRACAELLLASEPDMHEAVAQSEICGCWSLRDRLNEVFFGNGESDELACEARAAGILEFKSELLDLVEKCH